MKKIVLFASGSGTNAEKIIRHFKLTDFAKVTAVFTNNPTAKVIDKSKKLEVPVIIFSKEQFQSDEFVKELETYEPDLIVLAGFLWMVPSVLIQSFPDKILNIHPALLPKYGGKGMYGISVHKAVLQNKEQYSGITIHQVNEKYDEGAIIFQESISVSDCKTPEQIAEKVHQLEYMHYPRIIEELISAKL